MQAVSSKQISSAKASLATWIPNDVRTPVSGKPTSGISGQPGEVGGGVYGISQLTGLGVLTKSQPIYEAQAHLSLPAEVAASLSCASCIFLAFSPRFCLI